MEIARIYVKFKVADVLLLVSILKANPYVEHKHKDIEVFAVLHECLCC